MKYVTFSRGSTMRLPTGRLTLSTEEWTETEREAGRLDYPIGQYSIIYATLQMIETGLIRHFLAVQPDTSDWDRLWGPRLYGVAGNESLEPSVWIQDLGMESVII